jgi:hypothetical protein
MHILKFFLSVVFAYTLLFQYVQTDENISAIIEYKMSFNDVDGAGTDRNLSLEATNSILEGVIHTRTMLYIQVAVFAAIILFDVLGRSKRQMIK